MIEKKEPYDVTARAVVEGYIQTSVLCVCGVIEKKEIYDVTARNFEFLCFVWIYFSTGVHSHGLLISDSSSWRLDG